MSPVAEHHRVALGAELTRLAARQRLPGHRVDHLDLEVGTDATHRADLLLEGVVGAVLGGDRRGLCHAVGNRHLGDPGVDQLGHHRCRTRRSGHDPGPHRGEVVCREVGERPLRDEHRGHAVERRALLVGRRLQRRCRVEARRGNDHRSAVRGAREVAHDHAEAVVEGHRDAHPVDLGVEAQLADEVAVVEDVAVRKGGALGKAGGARRVLDVDRVVRVERRLHLRHLLGPDLVATGQQRVPRVLPEDERVPNVRTAAPNLRQHRDVVAALERLSEEDRRDAGLLEHELQLVGAVARVDVDQDRADLGCGVLHQRPLGAVRRPDPDALPLDQPGGEQRPSQPVHLRRELGIRPPDPLGHVDEGVAVREPRHGRVEVVGDGLLEERDVDLAPGVRQHGHGCHPTPPDAGRQPCRRDGFGRRKPGVGKRAATGSVPPT